LPAATLVSDQLVGGIVVGNPQQRLGEAHEQYSFLRREIVLGEKGVEAALAAAIAPHRIDEPARGRRDALGVLGRRPCKRKQGQHALALVGEVTFVALRGVGLDGSRASARSSSSPVGTLSDEGTRLGLASTRVAQYRGSALRPESDR
jgi:hypothetical protein